MPAQISCVDSLGEPKQNLSVSHVNVLVKLNVPDTRSHDTNVVVQSAFTGTNMFRWCVQECSQPRLCLASLD